MGEQSRRLRRFLEAHPNCCFCGGSVKATTIDHVPPRAAFFQRVGPDGFEFPACEQCQTENRISELVFSFYVRLMDPDDNRYSESDAKKLLQGLQNNAPELLPKFDLPAVDKRGALREYGIEIERGEFLSDVPLAGIPVEFHAAAAVVGRKLALAAHYRELGGCAAPGSRILFRWSQRQIPAGADLAETLRDVMPNFTKGRRVNTDIGDQFSYVWAYNADEALFALCAEMCRSLILVLAVTSSERASQSVHQTDWMPMTGPLNPMPPSKRSP